MDCRQLRKAMSPAGWIMLIYYLLMLLCTVVSMMAEMIVRMFLALSDGSMEGIQAAFMEASGSAWGYFLTAAVGLIILLAWKKPKFWKEQIWARGKAVRPGAFLGLLCIFLAVQVFYQFYFMALEILLNTMGLTMMEGAAAMAVSCSDSFSMFLYVAILAPVTEELLCRGLVQRTLQPFGKKLAILGSAFLFALMHGNLLQTPFAFLVGLILGYVAAEYSIAWAMVLHMVNNLVLGDMLSRLTADMSEMGAALSLWAILLPALIGAVVTLVRKRREIQIWSRRNAIMPPCARCFFSSAGVVTFTVLMMVSLIVSSFMLITPL